MRDPPEVKIGGLLFLPNLTVHTYVHRRWSSGMVNGDGSLEMKRPHLLLRPRYPAVRGFVEASPPDPRIERGSVNDNVVDRNHIAGEPSCTYERPRCAAIRGFVDTIGSTRIQR